MTSFNGFLPLGRAFLDQLSSSFWTKAAAVLALTLLADHLFLGPDGLTAGSTLGVFGLVLLLFVWALRVPRRPEAADYLIGALALGLCLALFNDPAPLAAGLLWMMLAFLVLRPTFGRLIDARDLALKLTVFTFVAAIRPLKDLGLLQKAAKRHPKMRLRLTPFILPLAALVLFGALLVWANPILENFAARLDLGAAANLLTPQRLLLWALVGLIAWSLLRTAAAFLPKAANYEAAELDGRIMRLFSPASVIGALILANAIFALQNGLDIAYLWAGGELPDGMTHAQYAHRGAYPLILTALLAGAFVLVALRRGSPTAHDGRVKALVYLWLAQNVFLVASAILRTLNYIEDYSLTLLRLSALVWMGLIAIGLILIVLRIVQGRSGRWLINANALSALLVLYACAFINMPAIVADYNVRHTNLVGGRGQPVDVAYLAELGPAALPALNWYVARLRDSPQAAYAAGFLPQLHAELEDQQSDWRRWTWAGERLLRSLPPFPQPESPRRWHMP